MDEDRLCAGSIGNYRAFSGVSTEAIFFVAFCLLLSSTKHRETSKENTTLPMTTDQLRKLNYIETKLAELRKEYTTAAPSRQKTIRLMVRPLKTAWEKITGKPYQKPMVEN